MQTNCEKRILFNICKKILIKKFKNGLNKVETKLYILKYLRRMLSIN